MRAVEAVARLGSLQAAAEELGVSIGAVSQQVIKTEQQLGRPLFERTSRGMLPVETAVDVLARLSMAFVTCRAPWISRNAAMTACSPYRSPLCLQRVGSFIGSRPFRNASEIGLRIDANDRLTDASQTDVD